MWAGLAPVFMKAVVQGLVGGPDRKPVYRVTVKSDDARWHWRHTLPQTLVVMTFAVVAITAVRFRTYPSVSLLVGSVYWGALNVVLLANFISRSWHGMRFARTVLGRRRAEVSPVA
jgi:cellulose synthase (UDP-forming)